MNEASFLRHRLMHQHIVAGEMRTPAQLVQYMGAMQAQEYAMAKWAIGLRLPGVSEKQIQGAFDKGEILRTHLLRPTWHFVSPSDIRWLLKLTEPRVTAINMFMYRKMEMNTRIFSKADKLIVGLLEGHRHVTRNEIHDSLTENKIKVDGVGLACILMQAELKGLICSGPRMGNQFTYALLEERVPPQKELSREESLHELTRRYFASRGPATEHDFSYWSGLTIKDAKEGIAGLSSEFIRKKQGVTNYIYLPTTKKRIQSDKMTFLMPDYDEYGMSYKDRSVLLSDIGVRKSFAYNRMIIIDGKIAGSWKKIGDAKKVKIETVLLRRIDSKEREALNNAIDRYRDFVSVSDKV